jgi:hypothetical protein
MGIVLWLVNCMMSLKSSSIYDACIERVARQHYRWRWITTSTYYFYVLCLRVSGARYGLQTYNLRSQHFGKTATEIDLVQETNWKPIRWSRRTPSDFVPARKDSGMLKLGVEPKCQFWESGEDWLTWSRFICLELVCTDLRRAYCILTDEQRWHSEFWVIVVIFHEVSGRDRQISWELNSNNETKIC